MGSTTVSETAAEPREEQQDGEKEERDVTSDVQELPAELVSLRSVAEHAAQVAALLESEDTQRQEAEDTSLAVPGIGLAGLQAELVVEPEAAHVEPTDATEPKSEAESKAAAITGPVTDLAAEVPEAGGKETIEATEPEHALGEVLNELLVPAAEPANQSIVVEAALAEAELQAAAETDTVATAAADGSQVEQESMLETAQTEQQPEAAELVEQLAEAELGGAAEAEQEATAAADGSQVEQQLVLETVQTEQQPGAAELVEQLADAKKRVLKAEPIEEEELPQQALEARVRCLSCHKHPLHFPSSTLPNLSLFHYRKASHMKSVRAITLCMLWTMRLRT